LRRTGKTTLAREIAPRQPPAIYLDLERPADRRRLDDPDAYLRGSTVNLVDDDQGAGLRTVP
jgi:hypothetical protein